MQITGLQEEEILRYAKEAFPEYEIEVGKTDFYLPHIEKGEIRVEGIEHPLYVSTHYAYEDRLVNGNQTRYKTELSVIYLRKEPYEILYTSEGRYYVAFAEEEAIQFLPYKDFQDMITSYIHIVEMEEG